MPTNTLLTPDMITREALRILHQKLTFVGSINRQYDSSFAQSGAKIGDTLRIRLPNQYTVRTGATLSAQDVTENKVDLAVSTQKGVDMSFTSNELTLDIDDFSRRILEPAMAVLASAIEADALGTMYKNIYNTVNSVAAAITYPNILSGRRKLQDNLAPDGDRTALLTSNDMANLVSAFSTLFNAGPEISRQYREGMVGKAAGFDFMETSHLQTFQNGARVATTYLTNQVAAQTGSSLIVDTGTGAMVVGDVFTIAGVYAVHPETKVSTGILQQFTVTAAFGGGSGTISISPAIVATGATQNVSNGAADNSQLTFVGTASSTYGQSMVYHKDAFTFATADLVMPKGVDFAAREVYDGISIRVIRQYDINNDAFPCRLDVLYGYKTIRPQLACRIAALSPTA
jgi:hypothetical protein